MTEERKCKHIPGEFRDEHGGKMFLIKVWYPIGSWQDEYGNQMSNADHALKLGLAALEDAVVALPSCRHGGGCKCWDIQIVGYDAHKEEIRSANQSQSSKWKDFCNDFELKTGDTS